MRLRPLLLATPLALTLPLAASAVTLEPVRWTSAGYGNPTSHALVSLGYVYCEDGLGDGCATPGGAYSAELPIGQGPTLSFDTGSFAFSADVVSRARANTWTVGLTGLSLTTPPTDDIGFFELTIETLVFAVLDVPANGSATTEIAFHRASSAFDPFLESDLLGPGTGPVFGGVNTFVAGDRLTLVDVIRFEVAGFADTTTGPRVFRIETATDCGTSDFFDTSDCTLSLSAFQPTLGVPEPGSAALLGAAAGLAALRRRRR
jgi:hypothetical protein